MSAAENVKLLPCPFCGDNVELQEGFHDEVLNVPTYTWYWVQCDTCCISLNGSKDKEEVINYWNRRATTNSATASTNKPLCASGQAKLPSFEDVKNNVSDITGVSKKDFSCDFTTGMQFCYSSIRKLGNFTKR